MKTSIEQQLQELLNKGIVPSFIKYEGMEQEGKNDYTVGCIQTANALMPVITTLIIKLLTKHTIVNTKSKHQNGLSSEDYLNYLKGYSSVLETKKGQSRGDRVVIDLLKDYINREMKETV